MDVAQLMQDLETSARQLDAASTRLAAATKEFETGVQLAWEDAVLDQIDALYAEYEAKESRVPAQAIVERRAARRAKEANPDLHADFVRLRAEMTALGKWIAAKRDTISARQSILSAEKALIQPVGRA